MRRIKKKFPWQVVGSLLLTISSLGLASYAGYVLGTLKLTAYQIIAEKDRKAAFEAGIASASWKTRLASDQDFANQACRIWWFEMQHSERKIKR